MKVLKYKSIILKATLSLLILVIVFILLNALKHMTGFNIDNVVSYVSSKGKFGKLVFILIYTLKPVLLFIPSSVISVAGGILFGPIQGFILNMIGFFLSGTFAFYLSRFLGKSFVDKILRGRAIELDKGIEKNGTKIMFMFRLPPIFPFDAVSYAAGITSIKYRSFMVGSLLGVMAETICYSYLGKGFTEPFSYKIIIILIITIFVTAFSIYLFLKKYQTSRL